MAPAVQSALTGNEADTVLHAAAARCDVGAARAVLDDGFFVDHPGPDGTTALAAACLVGCTEVVELLLEEGADTEATGAHGQTPLMVAASAGHHAVVSALAARGADLGARHRFAGQTALHMAAENGMALVIQALCDAGADGSLLSESTGGTPLHTAADSNSSAAIGPLLAPRLDKGTKGGEGTSAGGCGCDPEALMNGDTSALYLAAQHGFTSVVRELLEYGAEPTPVMAHGSYKGERHLSTPGAEAANWVPNAEAGNGATPLHAAAENGHPYTARALIDGGAALDSMDMGVTPLQLTAQYGRHEVTKVLVEHGAELESRSGIDGSTALYYAAGFGHDKVVSVLLKAGARPDDGQRRSGGTPLLYAAGVCGPGQRKALVMLLKFGARVDKRSDDGITALHAAASEGRTACVKKLLEYNAESTELTGDNVGHTALTLAVGSGHKATARALLAAAAAGEGSGGKAAAGAGGEDEDEEGAGGGKSWDSWLASKRAAAAKRGGTGRVGETRLVDTATKSSGASPLHLAAQAGDGEMLQLLVDAGAALESRTLAAAGASGTALYLAARSRSLAAVRVLCVAGADPNTALPPPSEATPLVASVEVGDHEIVAELLEAGAKPDVGSRDSSVHQAPLLLAVVRGHVKAAEALLEAGANCQIAIATSADAKDKASGLIDLARSKRNFDMLQMLERKPECHLDLSGL